MILVITFIFSQDFFVYNCKKLSISIIPRLIWRFNYNFSDKANKIGAISPIGDAVARFPPIVAILRICFEAKCDNISARAGSFVFEN